jgi:hypothetical protein
MTTVIPVVCALLAAAGLGLYFGTAERRARARSVLRAFWATLVTRSDPGQRYAGRTEEPAEERSYDAACDELAEDNRRRFDISEEDVFRRFGDMVLREWPRRPHRYGRQRDGQA